MLPDQRSPWMRDGRLRVTCELVDATHRGLDRLGFLHREGLTVDRSAYVRHDASRGEELGPRRQRAVGQRREADEAVGLGTERRRSGGMRCGEVAAEAFGGVSGGFALFDPGEDQAVFGDGQHLGHVGAAGFGQPAQSLGLADEHVDGGLGPRLDDGVVSVGEPQSRRRTDVAAGDRGGGNDTLTKESLRPCGGSGHSCHVADVTPCIGATFVS